MSRNLLAILIKREVELKISVRNYTSLRFEPITKLMLPYRCGYDWEDQKDREE
jgi:hypothetical protein